MRLRCYVIRGGFWGPDGIAFSRGMDGLAAQINQIPDVRCDAWNWNAHQGILTSIASLPLTVGVSLVGYSGGGMMIPYITAMAKRPVSFVVGYDPSPRGRIQPFLANVRRALCYFNTRPLFFGYGGGMFSAKEKGHPPIEVLQIAQNHSLVQFNPFLHQRTVTEMREEAENIAE
jgi:hypothetical protein